MKQARVLVLSLIVLSLVGIPNAAVAQDAGPLFLPTIRTGGPWVDAATAKPAPPGSNAYGKSLEEWLELYFKWYMEMAYAGGSPDGGAGRVRFMPLPDGELTIDEDGKYIFVGSLDVEYGPGTPFVLPLFSYVGESYVDDVAPPDQPFPEEYFENLFLEVTVDGKTAIDSQTTSPGNYYAGPYFPEPIVYDSPQCRDNEPVCSLYAKSAIWVQSVGFVHPPLSVGEHTITLYVFSADLGYGYDNTWNITVHPN